MSAPLWRKDGAKQGKEHKQKDLQSQACSFPTSLSVSSEEIRANLPVLVDIHMHILSGHVCTNLTPHFLREGVTNRSDS